MAAPRKTEKIEIKLDQSLDLDTTLESGQAFRWRRVGDGWHEGVVGENIVRLRCQGGVLEVWGGPAPADELASQMWDYLRMSDDLPAIQRAVCVDQHVTEAVRWYPGLRLLRQDPWECLISFICSSASNIPRICRTAEALAQAYGRPIHFGGGVRYTFPTPEELARAGEGDLRALGLGFRAPYVAAIVNIVVRGQVDLAALRGMPAEEARPALLALPGVGEKVADCVLLGALEKLEAFPIDRWVHRALTDWYQLDRRLSYARMHTWAMDHFGPYAGYAEIYLFHRRRTG